MPKISVIIPVYNKKKYIDAVLRQMESQSYKDFECILIDDGSTDDSGAICDEYAKRDERFKCRHIPNGGVSHARNTGLDIAVGEIITFIDADDTIDSSYLANLMDCMQKSEADMVISGVTKIWKNSDKTITIVPTLYGLHSVEEILEDFVLEQYSNGIYGMCVAKCFNKNIIEGIRFDETLTLAEDFDFYLRLYDKISSVYLDHSALYYYLQESENSSVVSDEKIDYLSQLHIQVKLLRFLEKHGVATGENRTMVVNSISNYAYNSLRYSPPHQFYTYFFEIEKVLAETGIKPTMDISLKGFVLWTVVHKWVHLGSAIIGGYRFLRKVLKR